MTWVFSFPVKENVFQLISGSDLSSKARLLWINFIKAILSELWHERNQGFFKTSPNHGVPDLNQQN